MRDTKTFLLGVLSVVLVATWVYHLYDKASYSTRTREIYIKDSTAVAQGVQDSLQKIYSSTISVLDEKLDSTRTNADSLQFQLDDKLKEIYHLKGEIDGILKNRGATRADLDLARRKIRELQLLVDDLKSEKLSLEDEQNRLNDVMNQLNGEVTSLQQSLKRLGDENKTLAEKVNQAAVFVASEISFSPVMVKSGREQETDASRKVSKLVISFLVQNNVNNYNNSEVFISITQPDGTLLKNDDVWESSTLTLHNGSRIPYTRNLRFEYQKGESKKLLFSINAEEYMKGTYTLQIFHNGYMIGQVMKTLK